MCGVCEYCVKTCIGAVYEGVYRYFVRVCIER